MNPAQILLVEADRAGQEPHKALLTEIKELAAGCDRSPETFDLLTAKISHLFDLLNQPDYDPDNYRQLEPFLAEADLPAALVLTAINDHQSWSELTEADVNELARMALVDSAALDLDKTGWLLDQLIWAGNNSRISQIRQWLLTGLADRLSQPDQADCSSETERFKRRWLQLKIGLLDPDWSVESAAEFEDIFLLAVIGADRRTPALSLQLLTDKLQHPFVDWALAKNPALPADCLISLAARPDYLWDLLPALVSHPGFNPDLLRQLLLQADSDSRHQGIVRTVLSRRLIEADIWDQLKTLSSADPSESVWLAYQSQLAARADCPAEILELLVDGGCDYQTLNQIAGHPNAGPGLLVKIINRADYWSTLFAAMTNSNIDQAGCDLALSRVRSIN